MSVHLYVAKDLGNRWTNMISEKITTPPPENLKYSDIQGIIKLF